MTIIDTIKENISQVGIKEVARRSGLSPSTVSRIRAGTMNPSLDVVDRLSTVLGFYLELHPLVLIEQAPRLEFAKRTLYSLKRELQLLGVQHIFIFGSVARMEDGPDSDIDIYLDFGADKPKTQKVLKAEGRILEVFGDNKIDLLSHLDSVKNLKIKQRLIKDGVRVF